MSPPIVTEPLQDRSLPDLAVRASRPRPDVAFLRARLSHLVALGFGTGLAPRAPGTVGTLWAWAAWVLLCMLLPEALRMGLIVAGFALGVWACGRCAEDLGVHDHGAIVWDEVIAFWLVLALVPADLLSQGVAFLLFRLFDIVKPPPIRHFDTNLKGGFGIMFDDLLAAFYTLLVIAAWKAWA